MTQLRSVWHWVLSVVMGFVLSIGSETVQASNYNQSSTNIPSNSLPHLIDILRDGSFFETVDGIWKLDFRNDILPILKVDFEQEFYRLKRARADNKGVPEVRPNSFSLALYGEEDGLEKAMTYYELDRTLTAVQALRWCAEGDSKKFNSELSQQSWIWLRQQFSEEGARVFEKEYADECYALITSVIINDIGKDPQLAEDYKEIRPGDEDISTDNHDMQLEKAINAGMVPSISRIRDELDRDDLRQDILLGINVAAQCNLGQLAQAENLPASLYPLTRFQNHKRAWKFRFMEQVLDLAGAKGHFDNSHAAVFTETVARSNRDAHKAAEDLIWNNNKTPKQVYDTILQSRYDYLRTKAGYTTHLSITNPSERALMRLFCLGGVNDKTEAGIYEIALLHSSPHLIPSTIQTEIIYHLNNDGLSVSNPPAIQITYLPAMFKGSLDRTQHNWTTQSQKVKAVAAILMYINEIYNTKFDSEQLRIWKVEGVTVIEKDVFEINQKYVKTDKFTRDPFGLLDYVDDEPRVPDGGHRFAVANWVEPPPSQSVKQDYEEGDYHDQHVRNKAMAGHDEL